MRQSIVFDKSAKKEILSFFGKAVAENGCLVEADDQTHKVLTPEGEEICINDFAGVRKGSEIFIKSDLPSLINLADALR
jgi:hypothetical protein